MNNILFKASIVYSAYEMRFLTLLTSTKISYSCRLLVRLLKYTAPCSKLSQICKGMANQIGEVF